MMSHDVMTNKENILPFKANGKPSCNHKIIMICILTIKTQGGSIPTTVHIPSLFTSHGHRSLMNRTDIIKRLFSIHKHYTVNSPLTETLLSGQFYLRTLFLIFLFTFPPFFLMDIFSSPLKRELTLVQTCCGRPLY